MTFRHNAEFFREVVDVADELERRGHAEDARRLRHGMTISSMPGVIFGQLRLEVRRLLNARPAADEALVVRLDALARAIDEAFEP